MPDYIIVEDSPSSPPPPRSGSSGKNPRDFPFRTTSWTHRSLGRPRSSWWAVPPVPVLFGGSFPGVAALAGCLIHFRPFILARSLVELDLPLRRRPGWQDRRWIQHERDYPHGLTPIPDIPTPPFGLVSSNRISNEQGVYYGGLESRKGGQVPARPLTSPNLLHAAGHQTPGGKLPP